MAVAKLPSIYETCEQLGIKPPTLRAWVQQRRIPYVKLGRRVLFDPEDIRLFIENSRVKAVSVDNGRNAG